MPFNLYVSPVDGTPQWWKCVNSDGVTFGGAFEWAKSGGPPMDEARCDGYYLDGRKSQSKHWRESTRDEAAAALYGVLSND